MVIFDINAKWSPQSVVVFLSVLFLVYVVATEILDWLGRMEVIDRYLPSAGRIVRSRPLRVLLTLVSVGLFVRVLTEHKDVTANRTPGLQVPTLTAPQPVRPSDIRAPSGNEHKPAKVPKKPPSGEKMGNDNTLVNTTPPKELGNGNTIIGATDANGNTILNKGGTAIGAGACADSTSVAVGAGAGAGNCSPSRGPKK